jgi:hypothetical protein
VISSIAFLIFDLGSGGAGGGEPRAGLAPRFADMRFRAARGQAAL